MEVDKAYAAFYEWNAATMRKLVIYYEDSVLANAIADRIDQDPQWELIAVCGTPSDLIFVLNRTPVDIVLMEVTPRITEGFIAAVRSHLRGAALTLWFPPEPPAEGQRRTPFPSALQILGVEAYAVESKSLFQ